MATQVQWRGGSTTEHNTFTGAAREVTVDTQKQTLVLHDGSTAGGRPLMREDGANAALALGSAGTPSLKFSGDPNTGIYSPGADQVAISTGGTGRLFVDASGNVGIGGAASANGLLRLNAASGLNPNVIFSQNNTDRYLLGQVNGDNAFRVYDLVANTERLRITSDGKVGIGTSAPSQSLTTAGSIKIAGAQAGNVANLHLTRTDTSWCIKNETDLRFYYGAGDTDSPSNVGVAFTNSGRVGIGTSSPGGKLTVVTATDTPGNSFGGFTDSYLAVSTGTTAASSGLGFGYDSTNNHGLILSVSPSVAWRPIRYIAGDHRFEITGGIEKARLDSSGRLLVGTSTATANGGVLQISNGITFPGTQSACSDPNTLDDYEEGTFAPTVVGTTAAGVGTYSAQVGRYTKVGNRVFYNITLAWTAHTGTGDMRIGGLPFTTNATTGSNAAASVVGDSLTTPASTYPVCITDVNNTQLLFYSSAVAGGALAALAIDTAAAVYIAGHYEV